MSRLIRELSREEKCMDNCIVVAFFEKGFMVKAINLGWEAAHDLREALASTGLYTSVLVGKMDSYFSFELG